MSIIAIIGARGIPKDFPGTSGIEAYIEEQLSDISRKSQVTCYIRSWVLADKTISRFNGATIIPIHSINTTHLDTVSYSFLATIIASFSKSDIIWYHGVGPAFFSFIPLLFKKKIYITIHALDWERKKWGRVAKLFLMLSEQIALRCANKIFTVSKELEQRYKTMGYDNVALSVYSIKRRQAMPLKIISDKYGLKKYQYILFIGRFVPEKRIEWLIRAADYIPMPIVLAGGSSHTDTYSQMIHGMAHSKKVIFTGYVFGREKEELLSNCRLFVLPSNVEGYPISVAEALSYNKICLVGDFLRNEYKKNRNVLYFRTHQFNNFLLTLQEIIKKTS